MTLHHITVESGQTRIAPRSKVSDDIVNRLKAMLTCAIELQKAGNSSHVAFGLVYQGNRTEKCPGADGGTVVRDANR